VPLGTAAGAANDQANKRNLRFGSARVFFGTDAEEGVADGGERVDSSDEKRLRRSSNTNPGVETLRTVMRRSAVAQQRDLVTPHQRPQVTLASSSSTSLQEAVFHAMKIFIAYPRKGPLMRQICYENRDILATYVTQCVEAFSIDEAEAGRLLAAIASWQPLAPAEALLIGAFMGVQN
jgi:hypothetical protein